MSWTRLELRRSVELNQGFCVQNVACVINILDFLV